MSHSRKTEKQKHARVTLALGSSKSLPSDIYLATGQEHDASHGGGHGTLKSADGELGDLLGRGLHAAAAAGEDHVGLQQGALQQDLRSEIEHIGLFSSSLGN